MAKRKTGMIDQSQLEKRVLELHQREPFFHRIDLGNGVVTPGAYGHGLGKVFRLMDRLQPEGRTCLDIGCMDGKAAFEMEQRGGRVVAVDQYDRPHMRLCMEALDSKATYLTGIKLDKMQARLAAEGMDTFDVIANAGVLYHAISPLRVLIDCRRMLKTGGLMILETGFVDRWDNVLYFQCDDSAYMAGSFFFPARGALLHMLVFVALVPLAMIVEKDRIAVLTQAMRPSKMPPHQLVPRPAPFRLGRSTAWSRRVSSPTEHARTRRATDSTATPARGRIGGLASFV